MPLYVILANWTDQGARSAKDSPRRLDAAKKALKDMGGEFKSFYLTMGDYDVGLSPLSSRRSGPMVPR